METIIIAGGSGVIGSRLRSYLEENGYSVYVLTRNKAKVSVDSKIIHWDIVNKQVDKRILDADHIINLCGTGIADKRWTKSRKKYILKSRIDPIQLLVREIKQRNEPIQSLISASAIGYYGNSGKEIITENAHPVNKEFLSDVCVAWEEEVAKAKNYVQHLSILRIGTVLSHTGGALEKMTQTIPFGFANYMGSGNQIMSWIHVDDLCGIFLHVIQNQMSGIYNAVAPESISNKKFTKILKSIINPKALLIPAPAIALRLALGELSKLLLNSSNVSAKKIIDAGYRFQFGELKMAISNLISDE